MISACRDDSEQYATIISFRILRALILVCYNLLMTRNLNYISRVLLIFVVTDQDRFKYLQKVRRKRVVLSDKQQRVYEWLNDDLSLPVFAAAYKGATILLNQKSDGYISFVAHTGRDLMNFLASSVAGIKSGRVQYPELVDEFQDEWQNEWRFSAELLPEGTAGGHLIPFEICQNVSKLIDEHKSGRKRSNEADGLFFSTFLDYFDKEKVPQNFITEWKCTKKWFLSHAHLRSKPFKLETIEDLEKHFRCLDSYLYIASTSQYDRLKELNEILDATNR